MSSDIILLLVVLVLGILVGQNWHNDSEREYKRRLLKELDDELKKELEIAKNLNKSLKEDIAELKRKIRKLEMEKQ
jgi:hypothetical protein